MYFSVILLCHFALCSSWLCCVFTPCYHSYSVLPYNLCCSLKRNSENGKKKRIRLVQK